MRRVVIACSLAILCATAWSQRARGATSLLVFDAGSVTGKVIRCEDAEKLLKGRPEPYTACSSARIADPVRCAQHTLQSLTALCASLEGKQEEAVGGQLAAVARDAAAGLSETGGRGATVDRCLPGLPQGDLLLPAGQLAVESRGAPLQGVTVAEDRAGAPAGQPLAGATLNADTLRGHNWILRGRAGNRDFICKFTVLSAADAQPLLAEYRGLNAAGTASAPERAFFFRRNDFTYEYWRALDTMRQH